MTWDKGKWLFEMNLPNLRADVVQAEQLLKLGSKPDSNLRGTLGVNLSVCEKHAESATDGDKAEFAELRERARKVLTSEQRGTP